MLACIVETKKPQTGLPSQSESPLLSISARDHQAGINVSLCTLKEMKNAHTSSSETFFTRIPLSALGGLPIVKLEMYNMFIKLK